MNELLALWRRDLLNEWRNFYQLGGLLAFLSGVCYLIYFFGGKIDLQEWSLLYWLTYLFLSFFIGARVYEDDHTKYRFFFHQLVHPQNLFLSKLIYVFCFLLLINLISLFLFTLFIPVIHVDWMNWMILCLILNIGMSNLICFSSLLNTNIQNSTLFLTILILPLSFPLLGVAYSASIGILEGQSIVSNISKFQLILGIDLITFALAIVLLPQLLRN
ncbi:MAG: heme exporter protein CcmB [Saprospiraceae bacterium]